MKKLIAISVTVIFLMLMYRYPHEMLSPGELVQGHQKLQDKCLDCHQPFQGIPAERCITCHALADIGKDTTLGGDVAGVKEKTMFHKALTNQECTSCHTDHKGIKPDVSISSFTHELLPEAERTKCNSCHNLPEDKIHKHLPLTCNNCHNTVEWKISGSFNHDLIQGMDKSNCISCHEAPADDFHQQTSESCSACHTTAEWVPSTFDHAQYFRFDKHHPDKCNSCHSEKNYSAYTCYSCHEHSEAKMLREHREEGIFNITNCAKCHKSGNEDEALRSVESNGRLDEKQINNAKDFNSKEKKNKKEQDEEADDD